MDWANFLNLADFFPIKHKWGETFVHVNPPDSCPFELMPSCWKH